MAAKTSLVLALTDRPGALGDVLIRIAARGLSLTKLESRPIPDAPFTYRFYVDVLGHAAGVAVEYGAHPLHELAAFNPLYSAGSIPALHAWLLEHA